MHPFFCFSIHWNVLHLTDLPPICLHIVMFSHPMGRSSFFGCPPTHFCMSHSYGLGCFSIQRIQKCCSLVDFHNTSYFQSLCWYERSLGNFGAWHTKCLAAIQRGVASMRLSIWLWFHSVFRKTRTLDRKAALRYVSFPARRAMSKYRCAGGMKNG